MNASRGFTLIEVLVSMLIFSIAMLFGLSFFMFGQQHMVRADESTYAVQFAQEGMEYWRSVPYDSVQLSSTVARTDPYSGMPYNRSTSAPEFTMLSEKYKVVSVTVTWTSHGNLQHVALQGTVFHP
jgi:prepilin-type N-terminal cleavage/methylation domain-containing protein